MESDTWGPIVPLVLLALTFLVEVIARPGRRLWRSLTRRRRLTAALNRLSCGVQVRIFEEALSQPATFRSGNGDGDEYLFVLDDVYVQVEAGPDQSVGRFAITTRSADFKPRLSMAGIEVVLGETTFGDIEDVVPTGVAASIGARRAWYAESYYFGNPGFYQTWALGLNDAGPSGGLHHLADAIAAVGGSIGSISLGAFADRGEDMPTCWTSRPAVARFREVAAINTLGITGPHGTPDAWPGPDLDQVRLARSPCPA